jgi:VanZ family protein
VVSFLVHPLLKSWLPVFGWMIFIGINSTDLMSAEHTSRFIGPFLRWFEPNVSESTIASVQFFVRKCAHLTEYAILAALLYRALRRGQERLLRPAIPAFFIAAICAALDECHQSFVSSRTGTPWDVAIDCVGALIGPSIYAVIRHRKSRFEIRK